MSKLNVYDVLKKPIVSEKSMADMGQKKYTFVVNKDANKIQIKEAVEKLFEGVKVKAVNTSNKDGKTRRRGLVTGKSSDTKKAIVTLKADSADIELFNSLSEKK